jgi:hypothetical protein
MSKQLAISSALSVLVMAAFALLGPHTAQAPFAAHAAEAPASSR